MGINHIALEVGDIDAALEFCGTFLEFGLPAAATLPHSCTSATRSSTLPGAVVKVSDERRHFGIAARRRLEEVGVTFLDGRFMDFLDPWGNRVEVTTAAKIQYTEARHGLRGMGLAHLSKTDEALAALHAKGMAPQP